MFDERYPCMVIVKEICEKNDKIVSRFYSCHIMIECNAEEYYFFHSDNGL